MRQEHISRGLAILSLATLLAACGVPAPAPKGNAGTKHGAKTHTSPSKKTKGKHGGSSRVSSSRTRGHIAAAMRTISLTTLPKVSAVTPFNPHMMAYHEISTFINEMGYHWVTPVPGVAYMTNQENQITGVEAIFPQNLGDFSWYDPPTPPTILNASLATYSEHLYFVPPTSITTSMSSALPTDLQSWSAFVQGNPRLRAYIRDPHPFRGYTVYAPPNGPGIKVLVNPTSGIVSGFMVSEPASWGWHRVYVGRPGHPFPSKIWGHAYYSVFMLEPPVASSATKATP
ncbi:MAG: hypothetical protein OWU33_02200 [Firmicutes bacterium]|nr:hypothetical protein [Bacillota bacterium]